MNLTFPEPVIEITETCFNWCREQNIIHQSNLTIQEMTFIVIALIAVVAYYIIDDHYDEFNFKNVKLNKIKDTLLLLNFIMLIMFIIYMVWLR